MSNYGGTEQTYRGMDYEVWRNPDSAAFAYGMATRGTVGWFPTAEEAHASARATIDGILGPEDAQAG